MSSYTLEEAKRLTGATDFKVIPTNEAPQTTPQQPKGFFRRLAGGLGEAFGKRAENISQSFQTDQSIGSKVLQGAGQIAGGIGDVVTETAEAGFESLPQGVQQGAKNVGVAILQTPVGQAGLQALQSGMAGWEQFKQQDPETAKNIEAVLNIASILPVGKGAQVAGKGAIKAGEAGLEVAQKGIGAIEKGASNLVGKGELTPKQILKIATEDVTPSYESLTKSKKAKVDLTRVKEGGVLEGRKLVPTKLEKEAGKQLSSIPGYDPRATALDKYKLANREVKKMAIDLEDALDAENVLVHTKEILGTVNKTLKDIPEKSLLLQKSDPSISAYTRVLKSSLKETTPGTVSNTKSILKLRQKLDVAYKNAGGKFPAGSDKIAALDDIHRAVRDSLTELLISKSSQPVKESLKKQWNLYRALDELNVKVAGESGSKLGRLGQKFPKVKKVLKAVGNFGGGIGVGTGIGLAD